MTTEFATGLGLMIAFLAVVAMIIRGQSPIIMLLILAEAVIMLVQTLLPHAL